VVKKSALAVGLALAVSASLLPASSTSPERARLAAARDEAAYRAAYQDLDRIRAEAARTRAEFEPYLDWQRASREIDRTSRQVEDARARLRDADAAAERASAQRANNQITREAENAAKAGQARAKEEFDKTRQANNDAVGERNKLWNDKFTDKNGKRQPREEIDERARELDRRLADLEEREREAAQRAEDAAGSLSDGTPDTPSLPEIEDRLVKAGGRGLSALDALATALEAADCRKERLDELRRAVHQAIGELAAIADAAAADAVFGNPNPALQSYGNEARNQINQLMKALKIAEARWTKLCSDPVTCSDPGTANVTAPSAAPPLPIAGGGAGGGQPPRAGGGPPPDPPSPPGGGSGGGGGAGGGAGGAGGGGAGGAGAGGAGGGGAPPNRTPENLTRQMPLVQDLLSQLGPCESVGGRQKLDWVNTVSGRFDQQFGGGQVWWTTLIPEEKALLFVSHRMRLYDLAGQFVMWNQLLPGDGAIPPGHVVEAALQRQLPQFVDSHISLQAAPGSLIPTGQPDTPEFRKGRAPLDDTLTKFAQDYGARQAAARSASVAYYAAHNFVVSGEAEFMVPPDMAARREAEAAARRAMDEADKALADAERAISQNPLLRREVDGQRLVDKLADPAATAADRQGAIDKAIGAHLGGIAQQFTNVREIDSAEELASQLLHPAMRPLQDYVAAVFKKFCFGASVDERMRHLRQIYTINAKDVQLDEEQWDIGFLAATTGLAILTLVAVLLAPEAAIPILLFGLSSADVAVSKVEYDVKTRRVADAKSELARLQEALAAGGLVDRSAISAAEANLRRAEFDQAIALAVAGLSVVGAAADGISGTVQAVKLLGQADAVDDAAGALKAADSVSTGARTGDAAVPAGANAAGDIARGPPAAAPAGSAGAASDFNPVGSFGDPKPPAAAVAGADEETIRIAKRAWGAEEANAHQATLQGADPLSKLDAAAKLRGAQFAADNPGGQVVLEIGPPIKAGGFGSVLRADAMPPTAAVKGLPAPSPLPITLDAMPPMVPLPANGSKVAVKLFEKGEEGLLALRGELEGAAALEKNGIPYAKYHAVGLLPDGTPYAVKELIQPGQFIGATMDSATQVLVVEGRAALARAGLVGLDTRWQNFFKKPVVNADGTVTEALAHVEADALGSVANPGIRMSQPEEGFDPFNFRFEYPDMPFAALGGGAKPIGSLMSLEDVTDIRDALKADPWVNNIIEAERRGEIAFDATTKTFGSGSTAIDIWRKHPEFGPKLSEYEAILQRTATSMGPPPAPRTAAAGAGVAGTSPTSAVKAGGTNPAASIGAGGVAGRAEAIGTSLAEGVSATSRIGRLILRLIGNDPFGFMATQAPKCWQSIESVTPVPKSEGGGWFVTFFTAAQKLFEEALKNHPRVGFVEVDGAKKAEVADPPDDPLYRSRGSWSQAYDDQWGLKRIGFDQTSRGSSAWDLAAAARHPIIVAVIDSGLDYFHPDLAPDNIWRNPREQPNGRDDDGNGYVDDLVGWNFVGRNNDPADDVGHGTHVAGIIGALTGNREGIAGINPRARIMPLKVLDRTGRGYNSAIAEAVFYAVRHGAHVINLSVGERGISRTERLAIDYAHRSGAFVVVAAGNAAVDTQAYGPAGLTGAIAVAATGPEDRRLGFSNFGDAVQVAAPGEDILSLRADQSDLNQALGAEGYTRGANIVGPGRRYYRASGTSFAAPFVSGVASLLLSRNPRLTTTQIENMILMSADDIDTPGWDRNTGAGRLNAAAALRADPDWYLRVQVQSVQPVRDGTRTVIEVRGTVAASRLRSYRVQLGQGELPSSWKSIGPAYTRRVANGVLGAIPTTEITSAGRWTIRVLAQDASGAVREARGALTIR